MAPSLGVGAFSWVGESFSFYLDESPFFEDMQNAFHEGGMRGLEDFSEKKPRAYSSRYECGSAYNSFKLTAFLAGLRAWIEQTAPGMTVWSNHSHKGQGYVKIAPGKGWKIVLSKKDQFPLPCIMSLHPNS